MNRHTTYCGYLSQVDTPFCRDQFQTALFEPLQEWLYLLTLFRHLCLKRLDLHRRQPPEVVNDLFGNVRRADYSLSVKSELPISASVSGFIGFGP